MKKLSIYLLLCLQVILLFLSSCHDKTRTGMNTVSSAFVQKKRMTLPVELQSLKITTSNGLPDNSVYSIYQDRKGFIWFCTLNGLARYDGNNFLTITRDSCTADLRDNRIKEIREDKYGLLWIRTSAETFNCYNPKTGKFIDYSSEKRLNRHYNSFLEVPNEGIWLYGKQEGCMHILHQKNHFSSSIYQEKETGSNHINFICHRKGNNIYIGTDRTLCLFRNGKIRKLAKGNFIKSITTKKKIFFLTENGKVYEILNNVIFLKTTISEVQKGDDKITDAIAYKKQIIIFSSNGGYHINSNGKISPNKGSWHIPNGQIVKDDEQHPWIYNKTGVLFRINGNKIHPIRLFPSQEVRYIDYERYHIANAQGLIWISTYGNGLFIMDPKTEKIQHIKANDHASYISSNFLQYILKDRSGGIWVSSEYTGVAHLKIINRGVVHLFPGGKNLPNHSNIIRMITRMNDGTIEVANRDGWLYSYSQDMKHLKAAHHFNANVYCMMYAPNGVLWIGTKGNGIYVDKQHYLKDNTLNTLSDNDIYCMLTDHRGRIWIGTFGGGLELAIKNSGKYRFRSFFSNTVGLQEVRCLIEDRNGMIWAGTSGGIIILNPKEFTKAPHFYHLYNTDNGKLTGDEIRWLMQDRQGYIWIAIAGAGIARCTIKNKDYGHPQIKFFDTHDGLVSNKVQTILEDRNNDEWISTEYGISHFIEKTGRFENHFFSPYMTGNVGSENSAIQLPGGHLLFGTNYGLLLINPEKTEKSAPPLSITFTGLKINGQPVTPGKSGSPMNTAISYTNHIKLKYNQNSFSINLSTLSYENPSTVKYQYQLEGYDKKWSSPSSQTTITYRYLPSGSYLLHARAANAYGTNGKVSTIRITIAPPFYFSWWAFLLYAIIIVAVTLFIVRTIRHISHLKNQMKIEEVLTNYKIKFFTNIAHEFRTPLTLIQGSLEKINITVQKEKLQKELGYSLDIMGKSTQRMLRLIDQLLTFQKIQNNKITLNLEKVNIINQLNDIYKTFKDSATSKHIKYTFLHNTDAYEMYTDKGHLDKIVWNLLSNAFKYTPSKRSVSLDANIDKDSKSLIIRVIDTGIGIPEEKQKELFSRFMQSHYAGDSFGIGLNLTKELVSVLKGTISYQENPEGGSIFSVRLPLDNNVYNKNDYMDEHAVFLNDNKLQAQHYHIDKKKNSYPDIDNSTETSRCSKNTIILLIEDDDDVRDFLARELRTNFNTITATDGKEGLLKAHSSDISLIISDVMMPEMNGFELTKKIKSDFEICHIPVILLTALASNENQLQGIESGADAYITKPFSPSLLKARIFQILDERERLRKKFSKDTESFSPLLANTEKDQDFVEKLNQIMKRELNNPRFSVNDFADQMGMGRTLFFRKIKGVSGYTPNEFIRVIRMKKGAEMLKEDKYTISEIAYHIGFESPFYFSKCFKEQFGVSPSGYRRKKRYKE